MPIHIDPENKIVRLCAESMEMEGKGKQEKAGLLAIQAWAEATTDLEKFTAAHYVARHQRTIADKLEWDQTALRFAIKLGDEGKPALPSLYLNIAKCYEDLQQRANALQHYQLAQSYTPFLEDDGYSHMIRSGIAQGISRVS